MIINSNIIEYVVFKSDATVYARAKAMGITESMLARYVKEESDLENMTLKVASKMMEYYKGVIEDMQRQYGTVDFDGREYTLTEQAYLYHAQGLDDIADNHYRANALDDEGNEYFVYWNPIEGWQQLEDGSDHCDWDNPVMVEQL